MPSDLALLSTLTGSNYPSRTNFHGPKGVRAIEVRLYYIYQLAVRCNRFKYLVLSHFQFTDEGLH